MVDIIFFRIFARELLEVFLKVKLERIKRIFIHKKNGTNKGG